LPSHLYLSVVWLLLGGCVGSFLNVVAYRLPRGLSIRDPVRSFCPACGGAIAWFDNIPIVSFLLLGGRCRRCRVPIPLRYPLVELVTAVVFVMTYQAFFVFDLREGLTGLSADWPLFLAHLALWAGLIALAVMDLEAYLVDITITWILVGVGLAAHLLWTPADSWPQASNPGMLMTALPADGWIRPGPWQSAFSLAVAVGLGVGALLDRRRSTRLHEEEPASEEGHDETVPPAMEAGRPRWNLVIVAVCAVLVAWYLWDMQATADALQARPGMCVPLKGEAALTPLTRAGVVRLLIGAGGLFVVLALAAGQPHPAADTEIMETIDAEAENARRQALSELKSLLPAIAAGGGGLLLLWGCPGLGSWIEQALQWQPVGSWRPVLGLATGAAGWILGGLIGWSARIFFTLVFGKEALGMGDVHILAAAGAVAGWPVVFLGFFLAAPLALLALVVIAVRRQSRALPYGPWLAMAFFLAGLFQDVLLRYFHVRWMFQ